MNETAIRLKRLDKGFETLETYELSLDAYVSNEVIDKQFKFTLHDGGMNYKEVFKVGDSVLLYHTEEFSLYYKVIKVDEYAMELVMY